VHLFVLSHLNEKMHKKAISAMEIAFLLIISYPLFQHLTFQYVQPGDKVIIICYGLVTEEEIHTQEPKIAVLDDNKPFYL
jgi:hypothetical protein